MPPPIAVVTSDWVDIAGTIVSVAAIVVALLVASRGPEWSARRRRPILDLRVEMDTTLARVRLRVENDAARETAQQVEVLVERVQISPRSWVMLPKSHEVAFRRVNRPLPWAETEPPSATTNISPGYAREVEFLRFCGTSSNDEVDGADPADAVVHVLPATDLDLGLFGDDRDWSAYVKTRRGLDEYPATIWLAVTCGNAPAQRYTAKVYYSGYWPFMPSGNAMRLPAHVRVDLKPGDGGGEPLPEYTQFVSEMEAIESRRNRDL